MSECPYRRLLFERVQTELPGVAKGMIGQVMFEMFHEFFDVSSYWLEDIPFSTVVGQQAYTLTPVGPPPGQIIRLAGVIDTGGVNQPAMMPEIGVLTLRDPPNTVQSFTATVMKTVILPCTPTGLVEAPSPIVARFFPGLLSGLLGKLMSQPMKSYSHDTLSVFHLKKFECVKTQARVAGIRRNTYGTNSWAYPQQYRVSGQRNGVSVGIEQSFGSGPV